MPWWVLKQPSGLQESKINCLTSSKNRFYRLAKTTSQKDLLFAASQYSKENLRLGMGQRCPR